MTSLGFPKPFDKNVSFVVATFLAPKQYKFLDWIDQTKLNWEKLSRWIDESILKTNHHKIDWFQILRNKNAVSLIYKFLCENTETINRILYKFLGNVRNMYLSSEGYKIFCEWSICHALFRNSSNYALNKILKYTNNFKNISEYSWIYLSENTNPVIISLLEQNQDKINLCELCYNPAAIHILKQKTNNFTQNLDSIWFNCLNTNPAAIDIIKSNDNFVRLQFLTRNPNAIDMIMFPKNIEENFSDLCFNSAAIDILKHNQSKIDYDNLSLNEGIIELDLKLTNLVFTAYTKLVYNL